VADAARTYSSVLPWLTATPPTAGSIESNMWMESLLVRLCQLSDQSTRAGEHTSATEALGTYRYWAGHWDATAKSGGTGTPAGARHRRLAWKAYYDTLSHILRQHLAYEPEARPATSEKSALHGEVSLRLRQRAELKRVETVYEGLLLKETQFPKASETNHEVESWVDSVMDNWRLLCGPTWTDADLGEGGKEGVARGVLDILYRAATKPSTRPKFYATFSSCMHHWPSSSSRSRHTSPMSRLSRGARIAWRSRARQLQASTMTAPS
jgi:hypothetical protein